MGKKTAFLKPAHEGISVCDMDASIKWYEEMLDFTLDWRDFVPPLNATLAFMTHGDFQIELFEHKERNPFPAERAVPDDDIKTPGVKHVAYYVPDLHALSAELKAKGVSFAKDIFPMKENLVAFICDNTGNLIELIEAGGNK